MSETKIKLPDWALESEMDEGLSNKNSGEIIEINTDDTEELLNIDLTDEDIDIDSIIDSAEEDMGQSSLDNLLKTEVDEINLEGVLKGLYSKSDAGSLFKTAKRKEKLQNEQEILDLVILMSNFTSDGNREYDDDQSAYEDMMRRLREKEEARRRAEEEARRRAEEEARRRAEEEARRRAEEEARRRAEEANRRKPEPEPEPEPDGLREGGTGAIQEIDTSLPVEELILPESNVDLKFGGQQSKTYSLEDLEKKVKISDHTEV